MKRRALCAVIAQTLAIGALAAAQSDPVAPRRPPPPLAEHKQDGSPASGPKGMDIIVSVGNDATIAGDGCSLREAVDNAEANGTIHVDCGPGSGGADTIVFSPTITTVTLSGGDLSISEGLTVIGNGADATTVDAAGANRHFRVNGASLGLQDITLRNGFADPEASTDPALRDSFGGAIQAYASTISIEDAVLTGNTAGYGGAVINENGSTTITRSTISGNSANLGGALSAYNGTLTVSDSIISGNTAGMSVVIDAYSYEDAAPRPTVTIERSSIVNNVGAAMGAASITYGTMTITNSTVAGNTATGASQAALDANGLMTLASFHSELNLHHATVVRNVAASAQVGHRAIIGPMDNASNAPSVITGRNSIIAETAGGGNACGEDNRVTNAISQFQIIDGDPPQIVANLTDDGSCRLGGGGADLLVLGEHGGGSPSAPPAVGSFAVDEAFQSDCDSLVADADQFGAGRRRDGSCDFGAVELGAVIVVDDLDPDSAQGCGLNDAIVSANNNASRAGCVAGTPALDVIVFEGEAASGTLTLTAGLAITDSVRLVGPGADQLTIDAAMSGRAIYISGADPMRVEIRDVTLSGNTAGAPGGAILARQDLALYGVSIENSSASTGGGVYAAAGLLAENSRFVDNTAAMSGGGILAIGPAVIRQSLLARNSGNGIDTRNALTIENTTISGNTADFDGGGIRQIADGGLVVRNSTIAFNESDVQIQFGSSGLDLRNSIMVTTDGTTSLCSGDGGSVSATGTFVSPATDDCSATVAAAPLIDSTLAFNRAGPETHALAPDSQAIDAIAVSECTTADQRGALRAGDCDAGAFELIPATITVDSIASSLGSDDGCTLIEAAANVNGDTRTVSGESDCAQGLGADTIRFALPSLPATISTPGRAITFSDPAGITIEGPGADQLTIDAGGSGRVMTFLGTGPDAISGLTLTGGQGTDEGNSTPSGLGGALKANNIEIDGVHLTGSSAGYGGGLAVTRARITNTTISGNSARYGGGIFFDGSGASTIVNTTISGNTASDAGAIDLRDNAGETTNATVTLSSSTVFDNDGVSAIGVGDSTSLNLKNTIVGGSDGGVISNCGIAAGGTLTADDPNLSDDASCMPSIEAPLLLGALTDNDGPTPTHKPDLASPAVDAGDCPDLTADQRGLTRPFGIGCEIGAVELQNQPPVLTDDSITLPLQGAAVGTTVATFAATDENPGALTFAITGGNAGNVFSIAGDELRVAIPSQLLAGSPFALQVTATDDGGLTGTAQIGVTVNQPPTISDASLQASASAQTGAVVGQVTTASDPEMAALTYQITAGNTGDVFAIDDTGLITVANPAALSDQFVLAVQVTDDQGQTAAAEVLITVTTQDLPPVITPQSILLPLQSATVGATLTTVQASDPEGGPVTFGITSGNEAGAFAIDRGTGEVTLVRLGALGSEATVVLTVAAADAGLQVATATLTVNIDRPPSLSDAAFTVVPNSDVGTVVGQLDGADPESLPLAFSIVDGDPGGAFAIDAAGTITVADPDALLPGEQILGVVVTDRQGQTARAAITITVEPLSDTIFRSSFEDSDLLPVPPRPHD